MSVEPKVIDQFVGEYRWLSNFWFVPVRYDKDMYPSVEHAYQAAKTDDRSRRRAFTCVPSSGVVLTPGQAKRMGRTLKLRREWEEVKVDAMRTLLRRKFADPILRLKLLGTQPALLVEGNTWGDTFWGVCNGRGQNMLGKLLMEVREEIASNG